MQRKLSKTKLALAVMLAMSIGGSVMAAEYNGRLIGHMDKDQALMGSAVSLSGNTETFTFDEDTTINGYFGWQEMKDAPYYITTGEQGWLGTIMPGGMYSNAYAMPGPHNDLVFDMKGHDLTVNHVADTGFGHFGVSGQGAYVASSSISVNTANKVEFKNIGKMNITNKSDGYYVSGLYAGFYRGLKNEAEEKAVARPTILIHNKPGWENAVKLDSGGAHYTENMSAVKVFNRGEVIVDNYADWTSEFVVDGVAKKVFGSLHVNTMGNRDDMSAHLKVAGGRWGLIYGYGNSLLELNTEMDELGHVRALDNEVQMEGSISVFGGMGGYSVGSYAKVHLGIIGENSYWRGTINYSNYKPEKLEHLFLQKGGTWYNPIQPNNNAYIVHLHGGSTDEETGIIRFIENTSNISGKSYITVENYEGNLTAIYNHTSKGSLNGNYIVIEKAMPGSVITMMTDNQTVDLENEAQVTLQMNALAERLRYKGYIGGEHNLTGKLKIAEGLLLSSRELKVGDVKFDEDSGIGYYKKINAGNKFSTTLYGDKNIDQEYVEGGVLKDSGDFNATQDITIDVADGPAVSISRSKMTFNLNNHNLSLTSRKDEEAVVVINNSSRTILSGLNELEIQAIGNNMVGLQVGEKDPSTVSGWMSAMIVRDPQKLTIRATTPADGNFTVVLAGARGYNSINSREIELDMDNAANVTVFEAKDGGSIFGYGMMPNAIAKGNGFLALATNGGRITVPKVEVKIGDVKSVSSEEEESSITVSFNEGNMWTGSAYGNGEVVVGFSDKNANQYWINQWQHSELAGEKTNVKVVGKGWIHQTNSNVLNINQLESNNINILYSHDDDDPTLFEAGDTIVETAKGKKSTQGTIHMWTDGNIIDLEDKPAVTEILQSLAKKLVYKGYVDGERNLVARVGITEGMLSSRAEIELAGGCIAFDEEGRGYYYVQSVKDYTAPITGGTDQVYLDGGVKHKEEYIFNLPGTINVSYDQKKDNMAAISILPDKDASVIFAGQSLHLDVDTTAVKDGITAGVAVAKGGKVKLQGSDLQINVKSGTKEAYGIYASGDVSQESPQEMIIFSPEKYGLDGNDNAYAITIKGNAAEGGKFIGIKADNRAKIATKNPLNMNMPKGNLVVADHGGIVEIGSVDGPFGSVKLPIKLVAEQGILAQAGRGGVVSMNSISGDDTYFAGDVLSDIDGEAGTINMLINSGGIWKGSATGKGNVNIVLEEYGGWINEWQQGSGDTHINEIGSMRVVNEGGAGNIYQKNDGKLIIEQGVHTFDVFFDHGEDPMDIKGGDIIINSFKKWMNNFSGSIAQVHISPEGVDLSDQDKLNKLYDAMAHKVYFSGNDNGSRKPTTGKAGFKESAFARRNTRNDVRFYFDAKTGWGYYYYGAEEQIANDFNTTLTGVNPKTVNDKFKNAKDYEYAQKGVITDEGKYLFTTGEGEVANRIHVEEPYTVTIGEGDAARETVAAIGIEEKLLNTEITAENLLDIEAKATSEDTDATGIYVAKDRSLTMKADRLVIKPSSEKGKAYGVINQGTFTQDGPLTVENATTGILADGETTVGHTEITASEVGAQAGPDGTINMAGGFVKSEGVALRSLGGNISLNKDGENGAQVEGDIEAADGGTVEVNFNGAGDHFKGTVRNPNGIVKMGLRNGALWENINDQEEEGLYVNELAGGDTKEAVGLIHQKNFNRMTIDNYSGHVRFLYDHDADHPDYILGGDVMIGNAAAGSEIEVVTDKTGIGTGNSVVGRVLEALANKVIYKGVGDAPDNLTGKLGIAEGLLDSSAMLRFSDMEFDEDGVGHLKGDIYETDPATGEPVIHDSNIIYGPKQTAMMRGAKSAMASTAMLWRATVNDVQKRLGELRDADQAEAGLWARIGAGRISYDNDYTEYKTDFTDYYLGYDKEIGRSGWRVGAAVNHLDGDAKYERGNGDNKVTTLNLYASKVNDDGSYIDIIARGGRVQADYHILNDLGKKLTGDYKTNGMALSVEYGKRIEEANGFYIEPQVELSWSRLASKSYDAHSDYYGGVALRVDQDAFDSLIGRVGVGFGMKNDKGHVYAKVSALHEFEGDFNTKYTASTESSKTTELDLGGTWMNVSLGGNYYVSDNAYIYGNVEKSFFGDVELDWRANAGIRWMF